MRVIVTQKITVNRRHSLGSRPGMFGPTLKLFDTNLSYTMRPCNDPLVRAVSTKALFVTDNGGEKLSSFRMTRMSKLPNSFMITASSELCT